MTEICERVSVFHDTFAAIHQGANLIDFLPDAPPRVLQAEAFMRLAHFGHVRKGAEERPYAHHPLMVFFIVYWAGGSENEQIAALLHDCVEDMRKSWTGATQEKVLAAIDDQFGSVVADLVGKLTNPEDLVNGEKKRWQKQQLARFPEIRLVKLADKLANGYDTIFDTPVNWSQIKLTNAHVTMIDIVEAHMDDLSDYVHPFYHWLKAQEV